MPTPLRCVFWAEWDNLLYGLLEWLLISQGVVALNFTWPTELYLLCILHFTLIHKKDTVSSVLQCNID